MTSLCHPTRRGPLAWLCRKFEAMQVRATLSWAEDAREHLAYELDTGPARLRQQDHDIECLRVRLSVLTK